MSHKGHDDNKCGVSHHPCRTLSYTLEQRAKDDDVIQINGQDGTPYPMKKQHPVLRNITLIGTEGKARIAGEFSVVGSYLFADVARGLNKSQEQVSINLVNLKLIRIGIIKLKNTLTTLKVQVVNCTVLKLSKSSIVDSSAAKTTVILQKSIIRQVSKGLQVKSREFSLSIESSKIDNSGGSYPGQDCPQFIVTDDFESLVAHFSKSSFKYTFLIDLATSHQKKSNVSIIASIFDDDIKNSKHNGCFSRITFRNTTALIVNSNFTNIIARKSLIKAIASFVTFTECIFSNISSKLGMSSLSSSYIAFINKTNAINNKLNGFNYGSVYLQSTKGIFQNCTFHNNTVNGQNGNGGAMYIRSSDITVQQCLFKENTVTYSGGTIKMIKTLGIFVNCTFEKNSVKSSLEKSGFGGAICATDNSHLTMHQCSFKDNTATYRGGATYIQESQSLFESCIFERNKVNSLNQATSGGAISAFGDGTNITIKQCLFKENAATSSGGAIAIFHISLLLKNSTFVRNTVKTLTKKDRGGAIGSFRNSHITVQHCLFKENTATYGGGAIFMKKTRGSFVSCILERNSVRSRRHKGNFGGAICALDKSHLTMHQCSFKDNTATYRGGATYIQKSQSLFRSCIFQRNKVNSLNKATSGGAISAFGDGTNITIKQCLFKENAATSSGGAIAILHISLLLKNSTFVRNTVKTLTKKDRGGAIGSFRNSDITVQHCLFKENTATYGGGAIFMKKTRGSFVSCILERNSVRSRRHKGNFGGAICALDKSYLTMYQCSFKDNTATYRGGATYIQKSQSLFKSCIFQRNKVNSLNKATSGGAISAFGDGTNITIKQCLFKENAATSRGGAIAIFHISLLLKNNTFVRNTVKTLTKKDRGGAIGSFRNSHITVQHCLFKENTATYGGGAIFMKKTRGSFVSCILERNSVRSRRHKGNFGGAICALDKSHLTMHQCSFKDNTATFRGGATYIQKSQSLFKSCIFQRNKVNSLNKATSGGAISAFGDGTNITIKQCLFKENAATSSGGAIAILHISLLLKNSTFVRNTVKTLTKEDRGGAIGSFRNSDITVQHCLFKENTATYGGGAIFMKKTRGSFVSCILERNSVRSRRHKGNFGGAICALDKSYLTMYQCSFKDNTATYRGGATYIQKSQSLFKSCIFQRNKVNSLNKATSGGAISAFGDGTNITIKQCLFKENSATSSGGAIAILHISLLLKNSTFVRNTVKTLTKKDRGGAIGSFRNSDITVQHCLFKENTATYGGGAIFMKKTRGSFVSCILERNSVRSRRHKGNFGGAICALDKSYLTMYQCSFKDNTATYRGGATYIQKIQSLFKSCIFQRNKVNSLNKATSGGAISAFGDGTNITIKQCLFKDNAATSSGGAIAILHISLLLKNSTFVRNTVKTLTKKDHGGAIGSFRNSDITVQHCLFKENTATYGGGAIFMEKTRGSFVSCILERNSVRSRRHKGNFGGAICALDKSHLTMHQCIFKENIGTYRGGATYIQKSQSLFESCIFLRNKVNSLNQGTSGGAISALGDGTNITIKQCLFKENAATSSGGAIAILHISLLLKNSTFVKNTVRTLARNGRGGAIDSFRNSNITVQHCLFKENAATMSGGAISLTKTHGLFENCTFVDNAVQYLQGITFGGAISSLDDSFCLMTRCLFKKNTVTFYGGEMQILVTEMFLSVTTMVSQPNKCLKQHGNLSENPLKP